MKGDKCHSNPRQIRDNPHSSAAIRDKVDGKKTRKTIARFYGPNFCSVVALLFFFFFIPVYRHHHYCHYFDLKFRNDWIESADPLPSGWSQHNHRKIEMNDKLMDALLDSIHHFRIRVGIVFDIVYQSMG